VERKQLQIFVSLLLSYAAKGVTATKVFELAQKLSDAGVTHIGVEPPSRPTRTPRTRTTKRGGEAHVRALGGRDERVINSIAWPDGNVKK